MPHSYLPYDNRLAIGAAPTRLEAGLPERGMVFCAFTSPYKINSEVFGIWMRLLRAVPESVLWLREMPDETRENLEREAQARRVDPKRLIVAAHVASMEEHLGRHALADLYLDTLPYNAHSTACDALWAGVPAKERRRLDPNDRESILQYARNYVDYTASYLKEREKW